MLARPFFKLKKGPASEGLEGCWNQGVLAGLDFKGLILVDATWSS